MGSSCLFYVTRSLSVWAPWQSALLAQPVKMISHHRRQKNYGSHTIAGIHNIACVNCSTCIYFFLKQTEITLILTLFLKYSAVYFSFGHSHGLILLFSDTCVMSIMLKSDSKKHLNAALALIFFKKKCTMYFGVVTSYEILLSCISTWKIRF